MSASKFVAAVEQLVFDLRRHFALSGTPPTPQQHLFDVPRELVVDSEDMDWLDDLGDDYHKDAFFGALFDEPPASRAVAVAVKRIPELRKTIKNLRDVQRLRNQQLSSATDLRRFDLLFERLLERRFGSACNEYKIADEDDGEGPARCEIGYNFVPVDEDLLSDLENAARDGVGFVIPSVGATQKRGRTANAKIAQRDRRINQLCKQHRLNGRWAKLAQLASQDPEIQRLDLPHEVSREIARNAVISPRQRSRKRGRN